MAAGKIRRSSRQRRIAISVVAIMAGLLIFLVMLFPSSFYYRSVDLYVDANNGRARSVGKILGLTYSDTISDTGFTALVNRYGLDAEPHWLKTNRTEYGLGTLHSDSTARHVTSAMREFVWLVKSDEIKDAQLAIRKIQQLARQPGKGWDVYEYVESLKPPALTRN